MLQSNWRFAKWYTHAYFLRWELLLWYNIIQILLPVKQHKAVLHLVINLPVFFHTKRWSRKKYHGGRIQEVMVEDAVSPCRIVCSVLLYIIFWSRNVNNNYDSIFCIHCIYLCIYVGPKNWFWNQAETCSVDWSSYVHNIRTISFFSSETFVVCPKLFSESGTIMKL